MSDKSPHRVNRAYSNLHTDHPVQETDDRLETLISMAEALKGVIQYLNNPHSGFDKPFISQPVDLLWIRYFTIRLRILQLNPDTAHMNQGERAQEVQQEMKGFALTAKKISTISRWDAEKTKDLM